MIIDDTDVIFHLFRSEEYVRKVIPHLDKAYFSSIPHQHIFEHFNQFFVQYDSVPSIDTIKAELNHKTGLKQPIVDQINDTFETLTGDKDAHIDWLYDQTEKFSQEKSLYNAIYEAISIIDKKSKKSKESIPELLSKALGVSFEQHIGHNYFEDAKERYDFYHQAISRISFDLDIFNKVTNGGVPRKTLNVFASATGVGKSLMMCHFTTHFLSNHQNVLYITLEMAQERIAERIDANLLGVKLNDLYELPETVYLNMLNNKWKQTKGQLVVKEYPPASANVEHFRALLRELKIKKDFVPDVIMIDYLTICLSARYKAGSDVGSYFIGKAIAEELRGLFVENNVAGFSAVQFNRGGNNNSSSDLTNISESAAIAMTADTLFGLLSTEQLRKENKILIKQLKNRLGDLNYYTTFLIGVDYSKMRVYELEQYKDDSYKTPKIAYTEILPDDDSDEAKEFSSTFGEIRKEMIVQEMKLNKFKDFKFN